MTAALFVSRSLKYAASDGAIPNTHGRSVTGVIATRWPNYSERSGAGLERVKPEGKIQLAPNTSSQVANRQQGAQNDNRQQLNEDAQKGERKKRSANSPVFTGKVEVFACGVPGSAG